MKYSTKGDVQSHLVRWLIGPLWAAWEKSPYLDHLARLRETPFRPREEVEADQARRLRKLVAHAYDNVPFYRRRFDEAGLAPADVHDARDLKRLPVLTKEDIRAHGREMIARTHRIEDLRHKKTSGSTGVSLSLYVDEASMQFKRGCAIRHDEWTGWRFGEPVGAVWGNPEYRRSWRGRVRNALLERFVYLDTLKMDEAAMRDFHARLTRVKPTLLFGHAHSLFLFARFMEDAGLDGVWPRGIVSTAMVLHNFEREAVERVFGCRVSNRYGCEEVSLIASECGEHGGMHLNMDTLVTECVRRDRDAAPGEDGAVVVTDLTNYAMPFIRYQVGDMARPSAHDCPCGRSYPLLERVEGRVADYVHTPDGDLISGISLTENFAMELEGVEQLQIVQDELDHLLFRLVPATSVHEDLEQGVAALVRKRFGERMRHDLEYLDVIEPEPSGKYRFCISLLESGADWTRDRRP